MILSQLRLRRESLRSARVREALRFGPYGHHQLLMEAYGEHENGRILFRYQEDDDGDSPRFLVLSPEEPGGDGIHHFLVEHKLFDPQVEDGDRLGFSVRINPVSARRGLSESRRGKRVDVVYDALLRCRTEGRDSEAYRPHLAQKEGAKWLIPRLENAGLNVRKVRCDSYRQHRVRKKGIVFSTLDCQGTAVVSRAGSLSQALRTGIGPAKGFGCGLLLIKRA